MSVWSCLDHIDHRQLGRLLCSTALPLHAAAAPSPDCTTTPRQPVLLEVSINGVRQDQDRLLMRDGCGQWYWPAEAIDELPLDPDLPLDTIRLADGRPYLPLASLGADIHLDHTLQQLQLTLPVDRLGRNRIVMPGAPLGEVTPVSLNGAYLDYDLLATRGGQNDGWGANLFARAFGPWGGLQQSGIVRNGDSPGRDRHKPVHGIRLDTTYTFDSHRGMWKLRLGDAISQSFQSGLPVRFAGLQLARDFKLQPGFLSYPAQSVSGSSALPSVIDVFVDDTLRYSASLPPGPFELKQLPAVGADGVVRLQVRDTLGRITDYQAPLLSLTRLLAPGLWDYALQIGRERLDYGHRSNNYGTSFASGGARYGVSDWLTLDARAEAVHGGGLIGLGLTGRIGRLGILTVNEAQSRVPEAGHGRQYMLGYEWNNRLLSLGARRIRRHEAFRQLGMTSATAYALLTDSGYAGARIGPLNLSFAATRRCLPGGRCQTNRSLNASLPLQLSAQISLTLFESVGARRHHGVFTGVSIPLDRQQSVTASYATQDRQHNSTLSYAYNDYAPLARNLTVVTQQDPYDKRVLASGRLDTRYNTLQMETDHSRRGHTRIRLNARGSLIAAAGHLDASRQVGEGFAIVDTGGQPDVPITLEHLEITRSNAAGKALVPNLYGYLPNRIGIDTSQLPIDVRVPHNNLTLIPQRGSGYQLDFRLRHAAPGRVIALALPEGWELAGDSESWRDGKRQNSLPLDARLLYLDSAVAGAYRIRLSPARQCDMHLPTDRLTDSPNHTIGPVECLAIPTQVR